MSENEVEQEVEKEDDLDTLLNEIESEEEKPKVEAKPEPKVEPKEDDFSDVREFVKDYRAKELRGEIAKSVETMRASSDALKNLPEKVLKGYLEEEARDNAPIQKAWEQRHANPERWNRIVAGLGKQLAESFKAAPDPQASKDREAVEAFVRSQAETTRADDMPSQEKLAAMSPSELDAYARQLAKRNET